MAKKRVEELKGFYTHIAVYATFNLFLFMIDFLSNREHWWFYWPLLGWGIPLAIHAVVMFGIEGRFGKRWEERKLRELVSRLEQPPQS
jgi:hypothetical protein